MALPTIQITDFRGKIRINPQVYTQLPDYINQTYLPFVIDVLGAEAAEIIDTTTLTQKWVDLFDGVYYDNIASGKRKKTKGLTWSVLRYLYFEFVRDDFDTTQVGNVRGDEEVSTRFTMHENGLLVSDTYNNGISEINCELYPFIDNYQEFKGNIDSFTDNGSGNYTIFSDNTIYLEEGDKVSIGSVDYTVSNLVDNASFEVNGEEGLLFSGKYIYSPFESVVKSCLEYIVA